MCAQSMISAPLLPPMSSSAAPLGTRSQSYLRDHQYWDPFTSHALGSASNHPAASSQPRHPAQDSYDGAVARWIADAAIQTSRARNITPTQHLADGDSNSHASRQTGGGGQKSIAGLDTGMDRLALQPQNSWLQSERVHRSMSPEAASRQNSMARRNSVDATTEQIASYLQIPSSINGSKGSLADLASQITCLFWFEDVSVLRKVEDAMGSPQITPLSHEATPTIGFRKWVTTLLSTTQVSQNVILLALLFIYRLKKITLNVQGKVGSEYRLLTVALMLGNKFLDDNTYTNKTWADVSGISVSEIHIMEVEFLSNMKYNLFTSASQWDSWHLLLGKFSDYFDKASRLYPVSPIPASMMTSASQSSNGGNQQPLLPFTPPSEQVSPPMSTPQQRVPMPQRQLPNPMAAFMAPGPAPTAHRLPDADMRPNELRAAGSRPVSRKRSYDFNNWEPPQKFARTSGLGQDITSNLSSTNGTPDPLFPRLPMPSGHISNGITPMVYQTTASLPAPGQSAVSQLTLPAPAMMTPETTMWQSSPGQPGPHHTPTGMPSLPALFAQTHTPPNFSAHARSDMQDISPTNTSFNTPQQPTHSPSGYLMYRNSPYRPVRQVHTLLAPPPSTSVQNPMQHMSQQHTFYQPLSKAPIEPRQGMVPYHTPRSFQMAPVFDTSRQIPPFDYRQVFGNQRQ